LRCWDILNSLLATCIGKWNSEAQKLSRGNSLSGLSTFTGSKIRSRNYEIAFEMANKIISIFNKVKGGYERECEGGLRREGEGR
jgi:hypothetical protein